MKRCCLFYLLFGGERPALSTDSVILQNYNTKIAYDSQLLRSKSQEIWLRPFGSKPPKLFLGLEFGIDLLNNFIL